MGNRLIALLLPIMIMLHSYSAVIYVSAAESNEGSGIVGDLQSGQDEKGIAPDPADEIIDDPDEVQDPDGLQEPSEETEPIEISESEEEEVETEDEPSDEHPAIEAADDAASGETAVEDEEPIAKSENYGETLIYINPVYEGMVDEDGLGSYIVDDKMTVQDLSSAGSILKDAMINREKSLSLVIDRTANNVYASGTNAICKEILKNAFIEESDFHDGDYLRLHCTGIRVDAITQDQTIELTFSLSYLTSSDQEAEVDRLVDEALDSLMLQDLGDSDRVKAIYRFVAESIQCSDSLPGSQVSIDNCSVYSALANKQASCQGCASLFHRLCEEAGITTRIVSGNSQEHTASNTMHTWNAVQLGDELYYADVSLDCGKNTDEYEWLLKGNNGMSDHYIEDNDWIAEEEDIRYDEYAISSSDYEFSVEPKRSAESGIVITRQPEDIAASEGDIVNLHIEALGDEISYQWQWSKDGVKWKDCTSRGADTDQFSFTMVLSLNGRHYRCIVTGGDEQEISDEAVITLGEESTLITVQPESVSASIGEKVNLHLEASGNDLNYQWQWSVDGVRWKDCTSKGFDTDTFSFSMVASLNGRRYRCTVSDGNQQQISDEALISLKEDEIEIIVQPQNIQAVEGEKVSLHIEAAGNGISYQWQWSPTGVKWKDCTSRGFNTDTFSFTMTQGLNGRHYRCIITKGTQQVISEEALISLGEDSTQITVQPQDIEASEGERVTLHIEAVGTGLSYQWQWSLDGNSWKNCTSRGYNTDTFGFKMARSLNGRQYHCVVFGPGGHQHVSNSALITLKQSNVLPEDLKIYEMISASTNSSGIQSASFKYGSSVLGRDLIGWSIAPAQYSRTILLNFEIHGWEDYYAKDGQLLVDLGNAVVVHYSDASSLSGCRLIVIPSCNPDGLAEGTTNNGFGRCNADGIDLNRDFDVAYQSNSSARNYTPYAFSGKESAALRDLVLATNPAIAIDFHGWENCAIGNPDVSEVFSLYCGLNHRSVFTANSHGYFAYWAQNQGAQGVLVEFKDPDSLNYGNVFNALDHLITGNYGQGSTDDIDETFSAYCPITTYALQSGRVYVQQNKGDTGTSYGYIDGSTDQCTIVQVYTDGWCKVRYPVSSNTKTGYCLFSEFLSEDGAVTPYKTSVTATTTVYTTSQMSTKLGSVWTTDEITVVAEKDNTLQIIYPLDSGGYKMGWINNNTVTNE